MPSRPTRSGIRSGGSSGRPGDDDDVQPDAERGVCARALDRVGGGRFGDHEARSGDDPLAMTTLDRLVDRDRKSEVVDRDDQAASHGFPFDDGYAPSLHREPSACGGKRPACGHGSDDDGHDMVADARAVLRDEASLSRGDLALARRRFLRSVRRRRRNDRARAFDRADVERGRRRAARRDGRRSAPRARRLSGEAGRAAARRRARRAARSADPEQAGAPRRRARGDAGHADRRADPRAPAHNYLAAVTAVDDVIALAHADISTGHVAATAFDGERRSKTCWPRSRGSSRPRSSPTFRPTCARRSRPRSKPARDARSPRRCWQRSASARATDRRLLARRIARDAPRARRARRRSCGASACSRAARATLREPQFYRQATFLALDPNTRKHLELTRGARREPARDAARDDRPHAHRDGFAAARALALAPLVDAAAIGARADCVEALVRDAARRLALQDVLHGCFDLERIAQKVRFRRALPRDLASLRRTLALLDPSPTRCARRRCRPDARDRRGASATSTRCSHDLERDAGRRAAGDARRRRRDPRRGRAPSSPSASRCAATRARGIAALEERERERTGIKSLKVKYARAFGYAIEVRKAQIAQRAARLRRASRR